VDAGSIPATSTDTMAPDTRSGAIGLSPHGSARRVVGGQRCSPTNAVGSQS